MTPSARSSSPFEVEVFYDGDCPLCLREVKVLDRLDRSSKLKFTDIAAQSFDPQAYGKTFDDFMRRMHARLPDGTWVSGVEAFRRIYASIGFRRIVAFSRLRGVAHVLELAYRLFAKNRLRLTGRCESDVCQTPRQIQRST